jgi:hypothetical protein
VQPAGDLVVFDTIISADYSDVGTGIDTGSVVVTLDGNILSGCVVTASDVSCTVSGLAGGEHTIGGSVSDNDGNSTAINGSFLIVCYQPDLSLGTPQPYWASYQDFLQRSLSITYSLCNIGANDAQGVTLVGSTNTNGVIFSTATPEILGDFAGADPATSCNNITLKYLVPFGVASFKTTTYLTAVSPCGSSYDYPGPYINPGG